MARVTIRDIAERAGVTIATASRALNAAPDVSEATRERVLQAAAELDYTPNAIAKALKGQRTNTIAFVSDLTDRPAADQTFKYFISLLAVRAAHHGLDLLIHPSRAGQSPETVARILQAGRADGMILADTRPYDPRVKLLAERGLPFITFGRTDLELEHPYVDVDGFAGMVAVTEHLLQRGHRRIAYLGVAPTYTFAQHRRDGFVATMRQAGLAIQPAFMLEESEDQVLEHTHVAALLSAEPRPTAIVAASDLLAITALRACEERGLRVGSDVAIVGFDDLPQAAYTNPPLTTLHQPFDAAAELLISLLLRVLQNDLQGDRQILLRPELVLRASS